MTRETLAEHLAEMRTNASRALDGEYGAGYLTAIDDCVDALVYSPAILGRFTLLGQWVGASGEVDRGYQAALGVVRDLLDNGAPPAIAELVRSRS